MVVAAGTKAMQSQGCVSNDNLSDNATEYVAKLRTIFPQELDTFLFVTSGSEANDLALQLARLHTRGNDVVVLERAYHGSLSVMNDMSPRQHVHDRRGLSHLTLDLLILN